MMDDKSVVMNEINIFLNGKKIKAQVGQTIWQVANQQNVEIPHLCYRNETSYRADGNCRACMVEVEGERTLVASCQREITDGMVINTNSLRVRNSQKLIIELLLSDQPDRQDSHDHNSHFWKIAEISGLEKAGFQAN